MALWSGPLGTAMATAAMAAATAATTTWRRRRRRRQAQHARGVSQIGPRAPKMREGCPESGFRGPKCAHLPRKTARMPTGVNGLQDPVRYSLATSPWNPQHSDSRFRSATPQFKVEGSMSTSMSDMWLEALAPGRFRGLVVETLDPSRFRWLKHWTLQGFMVWGCSHTLDAAGHRRIV